MISTILVKVKDFQGSHIYCKCKWCKIDAVTTGHSQEVIRSLPDNSNCDDRECIRNLFPICKTLQRGFLYISAPVDKISPEKAHHTVPL